MVAEQLARLAGVDRDVVVEAVPGDEDGLFWRTRMQYVHLPGGGRGLRKHRSHEVVLVDSCLIAASRRPRTRPRDRWSSVWRQDRAARTSSRWPGTGSGRSHLGAPRVLVEAVLSMLRPGTGSRALDLYAGVGLFSAFLADAVGPTGSVTAIEGDRRAVELARGNLSAYPHVTVVRDRVDRDCSVSVGTTARM